MATLGPHLHVSGVNGLLTVLYVMAFFGVMRLWAVSHATNRFAQAWLMLY